MDIRKMIEDGATPKEIKSQLQRILSLSHQIAAKPLQRNGSSNLKFIYLRSFMEENFKPARES